MAQEDLNDTYKKIIKEVPKDKDIFESEFNYELSNKINYPLISLGFHHLIHQNKDKMEILLDFKNRKKVYLVTNEFERYIDEYEKDIDGSSKTYFGLKKEKILSRAFFKLWEILLMFDVVSTKKKDFVSAHLAEGPGSFIQSTIFFRDKFSPKYSKKDKYYAITLHSEEDHVPPLHKEFIDHYKKEKPVRLFQHKTYPLSQSGGSIDKDNGDLTNPKTIELFGGNFKNKKADFITADGGFNWNNENTQEQEAFRLIFSQVIMALKIQNKGGNFVCKLFESFTITTVKLISIVNTFYDKVFIVKPYTSRKSNSERYIVCLNYLYSESDKKKESKIKKLDKILKDLHENKSKFLVDLFKNYNPSTKFMDTILDINNTIANKQLVAINNITTFINGRNYYGNLYNQYRDEQIKASEFWINQFYVKKIDDYKNRI